LSKKKQRSQDEEDTLNRTPRNEFGLPNIVIPAEVLFHSGLSSTEKILFGIINNLSATEDGCWACNRYLSNFLNLKSQTVSNAISTLKNFGFLKVIITQRADGMQVRRIFIDKDYLKKYEEMLIEVYKKINRGVILKKSKPPIKKIKEPYNNSLNKIDKEISNEIENNIYTPFLENWNKNKIIIHKKITSKKETSIKKALKDYTQEEIFKAFQNYATVLHSPDYLWSYTWTMEDFLQRGLHKFVDEANPLNNNFKNNSKTTTQPQQQPQQLSESGFPLIPKTFVPRDRYEYENDKSMDEWQREFEANTQELLKSDIWLPHHKPDKIKIFNALVTWQEWTDKIDYSLYGLNMVQSRINPLKRLVWYFAICVTEWWGGWMKGVKDDNLNINSKIFKMFVRELEDSLASVKVEIKSGGWVNDSDWESRD